MIARSKLTKGGIYQRFYPAGPEYAPVTGYDSIYASTSPFGATGIEKAEDKFLAGTASSLAVYNIKGLFTGKPKQGASVYLTISPRAQAAAYRRCRRWASRPPRSRSTRAPGRYSRWPPTRASTRTPWPRRTASSSTRSTSGSSATRPSRC